MCFGVLNIMKPDFFVRIRVIDRVLSHLFEHPDPTLHPVETALFLLDPGRICSFHSLPPFTPDGAHITMRTMPRHGHCGEAFIYLPCPPSPLLPLQIIMRHDTGLGEAYMDRDFECTELGGLMAMLLANAEAAGMCARGRWNRANAEAAGMGYVVGGYYFEIWTGSRSAPFPPSLS